MKKEDLNKLAAAGLEGAAAGKALKKKLIEDMGLLTDDQVNGKKAVTIMNLTGGRKPFKEGKAYIRKVHQGDRQGVYADVEFLNERGTTYQRWVFAKNQE